MTDTLRSPKQDATPVAAPAKTAELPPEWAIERLIKTIGKVPGAMGRVLDRMAKVPVLGAGVRFFSSVWVGIILLVLIGGYIGFGSGFADFRARMEMTDLQFFDAWPMRVLLGALALDLIVVTLRRIPLTLFKLGSWTVHVGILTLIGGSVWYFSHKQEGSTRIYLNQSVDYAYDVAERALYVYPVNADGMLDRAHPTITAVPGLPYYNEHDGSHGAPINIALPTSAIPGSTGATARVTSYYPFAVFSIADYLPAKPGEIGVGPAVAVAVSIDGRFSAPMWMEGNSPKHRMLEWSLPFNVEYLYHPDAQRLKDLQMSFEGAGAITVRIPKLHVDRTYPIMRKPDSDNPNAIELNTEAIEVEGSPYTITPQRIDRDRMLSEGYKGAMSSLLWVGVSRKLDEPSKPLILLPAASQPADQKPATFDFTRVCVSRFPERSPDFVMEDGKQVRKQDGVDHDIEIIFHDASQMNVWIVEGEDGKLSAVIRTTDGHSATVPVGDEPITLPGGMGKMTMKIAEHLPEATRVIRPEIIPNEDRPQGLSAMDAMQLSVIGLDIAKADGTTIKQVYVPFAPFADVSARQGGDDDDPPIVDVPGVGKMAFVLSTTRIELPSSLKLVKFEPVKYPGAMRFYQDYISTLEATDKDGTTRTLVAQLNHPANDHGLTYFQSAWDGDDNAKPEKRYTVIGVGNRPGILVMIAGAILIVIGIGYAFYLKPLLLKVKKDSLAAWNASRQAKQA